MRLQLLWSRISVVSAIHNGMPTSNLQYHSTFYGLITLIICLIRTFHIAFRNLFFHTQLFFVPSQKVSWIPFQEPCSYYPITTSVFAVVIVMDPTRNLSLEGCLRTLYWVLHCFQFTLTMLRLIRNSVSILYTDNLEIYVHIKVSGMPTTVTLMNTTKTFRNSVLLLKGVCKRNAEL